MNYNIQGRQLQASGLYKQVKEVKKVNVYAKLLKVQTELKAPKKRHNGFADYNYRSCEDILESAKPLLKEVGAVILLKDRVEEIAGRWYIVATAAFVDAANGERVEVEASARETAARPKFDDAQLTGAASSYARKYALSGLLGVDDGADVDALPDSGNNGRASGAGKAAAGPKKSLDANGQKKSSAAAAPKTAPAPRPAKQTAANAGSKGQQELINAVQAQLLIKAAERNGVQLESILRSLGITDLMQMPEKSYREEITKLQRRTKEGSAGAEGSSAGK